MALKFEPVFCQQQWASHCVNYRKGLNISFVGLMGQSVLTYCSERHLLCLLNMEDCSPYQCWRLLATARLQNLALFFPVECAIKGILKRELASSSYTSLVSLIGKLHKLMTISFSWTSWMTAHVKSLQETRVGQFLEPQLFLNPTPANFTRRTRLLYRWKLSTGDTFK